MYIFLAILLSIITAEAEIKVWEIPDTHNEPFKTQSWKAREKAGEIEKAIVIENETLSVLMFRNSSEINIWDKQLGPQRRLLLSVFNTATSAIKSASITMEETDKTEASFSFSDGRSKVSMTLQMGAKHIEIRPIADASFITLNNKANYVVIPGLSEDDKVYEATTNTPVPLIVPAQSVILELIEGMDSILLLMWTNTPTTDMKTSPAESSTEEVSRNVELYSTNNTFTSTKLAFLGKSIYLGLLSEPNIWYGANIRKIPGGIRKQIEWKRPFDAVWRANFIISGYDPAEVQTFLKRASELGLSKGKEREWALAFINIDQQRSPSSSLKVESSYFKIEKNDSTSKQNWPCTFIGNKTFITIPATLPYQSENATGRNTSFSTQLNLIHIYSHILVYPLDRTDKTPIEKFTVVDIMRQALGIGPCKLDWLEDASLH